MISARALKCRGTRRIEGRGVRRAEEVAEELPRAQRRGSDLDEPQTGRVRERTASTEPEHLAPLRGAPVRQASRPQHDLRRDPVDRGDSDEMAGDRALAEEKQRDGAWQADTRRDA